jgi:catechol 2,3-dioxygenase-like lactoylglutathione lyase family enzyme
MCSSVSRRVSGVLGFALTTQCPERLARFYQELGFATESAQPIPTDELAVLGLSGRGKRVPLRLGGARVTLDCFDDPGREYPRSSTAADLCFQHFALVADDAAAAWKQAIKAGAEPISPHGPVTLPASSGGVTACKFRDPEGHPLEFLEFPSDRGQGWQGKGLLGIDHSAISVSSADASKRFYEGLGLSIGCVTLNEGEAQEALDGLPAPIVEVVPMLPPRRCPHLELLAYKTPVGRANIPLAPNDVAATRIIWDSDRDELIRDPDGHPVFLKTGAIRQ